MRTLTQRLKNYLMNNSRDKIMEDWDRASKFNDVRSPKVQDFMESIHFHYTLKNRPPDLVLENFVNNIKNPKFTTSDFFIS